MIGRIEQTTKFEHVIEFVAYENEQLLLSDES